jgi:hypothetical protein
LQIQLKTRKETCENDADGRILKKKRRDRSRDHVLDTDEESAECLKSTYSSSI